MGACNVGELHPAGVCSLGLDRSWYQFVIIVLVNRYWIAVMTQWPRRIITLYLYSPLCYKGLCDWTAPAGILILGLNFVKLNRFVWPIHCVERWSAEESNHIHYSHYTEPIRRITSSTLKLIEIGLNPHTIILHKTVLGSAEIAGKLSWLLTMPSPPTQTS